jgi:hypothetical protein
MIWVLLWAAAVIAFLVFIFRGHFGWFLLWVLGLVALIASAFLQDALMRYRGFGDFVETASRVGWAVLITAVTVLIADLAAMIVYTLRHGQSDHLKGKVITENRPLGSLTLGYPPLMGRSKRKMLGGKSGYVTMDSLVDGTATFAERMMVAGILTLMVSFFLIFVGVGLMLMKNLLIMALFPIIPGLWLYRIARYDWQEYRNAKKSVAALGRSEQAADNSKTSGRRS